MNKSSITNVIALVCVVGGYFSPWYSHEIFSAGIFALSGALTNWLAVHMLFEKVPLLYGSGVILLYFEDLKRGIKELIMEEFFQEENVDRFLKKSASTLLSSSRITNILDIIDYDGAFNALKDMIFQSNFATMLRMFSAEDIVEKYRPTFKEKMRAELLVQISRPDFIEKVETSFNNTELRSDIINHLETLIEDRLQELTPLMVKNMIQKIIHKHLGWLVVWGGIFGALIGLILSFLTLPS